MKIWVGLLYRGFSVSPVEVFTDRAKADEWFKFVKPINDLDYYGQNGSYALSEMEADSWFSGKNKIVKVNVCRIENDDGVITKNIEDDEYYLSDDSFLDYYLCKDEVLPKLIEELKEKDTSFYVRMIDKRKFNKILKSIT